MKEYLKHMKQQGIQQQMQEAPPSTTAPSTPNVQQADKEAPEPTQQNDFPLATKAADKAQAKEIRMKTREERREERGRGRILSEDEHALYQLMKKNEIIGENQQENVDKLNELSNQYKNSKNWGANVFDGNTTPATPQQTEAFKDIHSMEYLSKYENRFSGQPRDVSVNNNISSTDLAAMNLTLYQNGPAIKKYERSMKEINEISAPSKPAADSSLQTPLAADIKATPQEISGLDMSKSAFAGMLGSDNPFTSTGISGGQNVGVIETTTVPACTTPSVPAVTTSPTPSK